MHAAYAVRVAPPQMRVVVLDLDGMDRSHARRDGLAVLRRAIEIDQRHFPETLHRFFIVNAPFLLKAVWALVAPWLDPHTQTKIQIFGAGLEASGAAAALRAEIDDENLPAFLGGACRCPGGCVPVPQALRTRGGYAVSATYED